MPDEILTPSFESPNSLDPSVPNPASPAGGLAIESVRNFSRVPKNSPWIIILSLLLVAAISAAGYFFWQNKQIASQIVLQPSPTESPVTLAALNPTADWKTYENNLFNFSLKYPTEYSLNDTLQTSVDPSAWTTRNTLTLENSSNNCSLVIMINPDGFGPNFPNYQLVADYVEGEGFVVKNKTPNTENLTPELYNVIVNGQIKKGSVSGMWASYTCPDNDTNRVYADKIFPQILSTFKFTDSGISEEQEVRKFVSEFADIYSQGDWNKLSTKLTVAMQKDMELKKTNLGLAPKFDKHEILKLVKNPNDSYTATVTFYLNNKPYPNVHGDPTILVTKEGNEWKSMTWYLFE